mmetsp:Transcript_13261/g.38542  ORF Transcript_13261/g.38542 Transcript_13261/m.38542 type:complete len:206 (-) Transcript_13261:552-1169(-)
MLYKDNHRGMLSCPTAESTRGSVGRLTNQLAYPDASHSRSRHQRKNSVDTDQPTSNSTPGGVRRRAPLRAPPAESGGMLICERPSSVRRRFPLWAPPARPPRHRRHPPCPTPPHHQDTAAAARRLGTAGPAHHRAAARRSGTCRRPALHAAAHGAPRRARPPPRSPQRAACGSWSCGVGVVAGGLHQQLGDRLACGVRQVKRWLH